MSPSGEIVGLIGPNGAGKTTAFNVACGFVKPSQGHVHYPSAGKSNLQAESTRRCRRGANTARRGTLPSLQRAGERDGRRSPATQRRFHRQFLLAAQRGALRARASSRRARHVGASAGSPTWPRACPSAIPYGIAKKVSIARALMSAPTLLLLDEPASGLDEAELEDFAQLIVELRTTMGVLLVEHDMEFVMPLVDRLVVLELRPGDRPRHAGRRAQERRR